MPITLEFADNPDPRCACVLLLDNSGSMIGDPIDALNAGLRSFQVDLQDDHLARRRVELAIVTFGGTVEMPQDFVTAGNFTAPVLYASGETPMGSAINKGLDLIAERKSIYKQNGIVYYRPWVFMITDGAPTDGNVWRDSAKRVRQEMAEKKLEFFAVGVRNADMQVLSEITPRALKLEGLKFNELFIWLSQSQRRASASTPGVQVEMPKVSFGSPINS